VRISPCFYYAAYLLHATLHGERPKRSKRGAISLHEAARKLGLRKALLAVAGGERNLRPKTRRDNLSLEGGNIRRGAAAHVIVHDGEGAARQTVGRSVRVVGAGPNAAWAFCV